jgi:hypothetical protein
MNPARLLASAAVVLVFPSAAVGARLGSKPGPAQRAAIVAARATLLRHTDLRGWSSTAGPKKAPALTCGAFAPDVSGSEPLGAAASPTFAEGSSGPFVSEIAYVYGSSAKERTFWHRVVVRRLETCVADSLKAGSTSSVTFKVNHESLLSLPRIGARDAGYRVAGTALSTDGSQSVYLDVLVVGNGSAVGAVSFTNFFNPVSRSLELRLARVVAKRLGNAG